VVVRAAMLEPQHASRTLLVSDGFLNRLVHRG
jgi:hypothetical protein